MKRRLGIYDLSALFKRRVVMRSRRRVLFLLLVSFSVAGLLMVSSADFKHVVKAIHNSKIQLRFSADTGDEVQQERAAQGPKRILLVTYGRSGSTFTSYILKEAPGAFFFFEPLRPLLMRFTKGEDVIMNYTAIGAKFLQPQELPAERLTSYERKAVGMLEQIFDCDIHKFPIHDYHSMHFRTHGDVAKVANCLWELSHNRSVNLAPFLRCLVDFNRACDVSPVRIVKAIRLPLRAIFRLMRRYEGLKLVFLARDPRAVIASQSRAFGHAPKSLEFCRMVLDDVRHLELLQTHFPGRAVAVRYEDISASPLQWTRRIYRALDLTLTPKVVDKVKNMTSGPAGKKEWIYSIVRSDAKSTSSKWRTKIDLRLSRAIDKDCRQVYGWLGYKAAHDNETLHNLKVPLFGPTNKIKLL